ncbi:MAG: glycosyl transferase [Verrucomicrobia bacterium]|nr:glycosyl transferase [Verrucomicrobiota bacterium]
MKLGFICLNGSGHLNPMTALARKLQARNHEVIFLYSSEAAGLPVFFEENSADPSIMRQAIAEVSKMQGEDALEFGVKTIIGFTESMLDSLPATAAETGVEALLIDAGHFYAELGAIQLGIPYIHVANAMHSDYSGYTPLWPYGWPYEDTEQARARNREGVARFARMVERNRAGVERYAERVGLRVDWADLSSTTSPLASITQVPRAFDFESCHWPKQFYHTGPFHDGVGRTNIDFPWERLTGEPLIYASMGTILNGNLDVFQTMVTALAKRDDLQLVLSVGDQVDPQRIVSAPRNAIIVPRAPQLELLKLASVCITHAGLNTVLESLAQGVPQVAIPVTFDQPGVAARIAYRKTGVVTSLDKLTPDHLSELLDEVLINPAYRTNAKSLQRKIIEANGLAVAADIVEEALGIKEKSNAF